ncbi:hypothetical protein EVAR_23003_1 [Eumeta japonica]|uniref:RNA-directed DNA polymerase from transposon BS n=1 Tax=Eumeta variegata TaxID=151549 RepID=A0A4C1UQ20_EUMVA|nr:hypothetical protein EVAR_23003_1 [Eumeta japonica]
MQHENLARLKRVSTALEEVDTPNLNVIPDDIVSNNDIDTAIGALTKHIRSVVKRCQRKVPANSDRRGLPADVRELIRAKTQRRASAYPTPEYRSRARASNANIELQCSLNPAPPDLEHVNRVENEVLRRSSLPPKDDLPSVSADEVQKLIRELKPRKAPGLDGHFCQRLITAGVPQGSTLPAALPAYTNDIPRPQTGVQLALFADDTALYLSGSNFRIITSPPEGHRRADAMVPNLENRG